MLVLEGGGGVDPRGHNQNIITLSLYLFHLPNCSYVLLHHVMGEIDGIRNAWGYAEGGNGAVSMAIAKAAESHGATLATNSVCNYY